MCECYLKIDKYPGLVYGEIFVHTKAVAFAHLISTVQEKETQSE